MVPVLAEGRRSGTQVVHAPLLVDAFRSVPLSRFFAMAGHRLAWFPGPVQSWIELVLDLCRSWAWAGLPFFTRGVDSVRNRSPNMWTLIALGTGARVPLLASWQPSHRNFSQRRSCRWGGSQCISKAAAVIISLTLLGPGTRASCAGPDFGRD